MKSGSRNSSRAGFSLFEMLVVLTILGVVSTIGIGMFATVTSAYRTTEKRMDLESVAQQALDSIAEDCSLVTASNLAGKAIVGKRAMEEQSRYGRVPLENDKLIMPVSYTNPLEERLERVSIAYAVDRSGPVSSLVRSIQGGYGHDDPSGAREEIAAGVLSLRFAYFDGTNWVADWSANEHPRAIRASITLYDLDRPYEQLSRSAAFPVQVR